MRRSPIPCLAVGLLAFALFFVDGQALAQNLPDGAVVGKLELAKLEGGTTRIDAYSGQVRVVNFWATWCLPCREEIPIFKKMQDRYASRGFTFIGVDIWDDADAARDFAAKTQFNYPVMIGTDDTAKAFGLFQGLPVSFLIDRDGRVVKRYNAFNQETISQLERDIESLLGGQQVGASIFNVSLLAAFLAGLLSFLSPCVLPLVPSYVSFITGISYEDLTQAADRAAIRRKAMIHSLLFIVGFSLVFMLLGASATFLGSFFALYKRAISIVVGAIIIVFGLHIAEVFTIPWLYMEKRVEVGKKKGGYLGSIVIGLAFGFGWTPCIGPILSAILGVAATSGQLTTGVTLLAAYSLGLGIPFFLASMAFNTFLQAYSRIRKYIPIITRFSGWFLVAIGLLIMTGLFTRLAIFTQRWMSEWFPALAKLG